MIPICLLPAAGASSRMRGGDKLLEPVDGLPCLATMAKRAISAGFEVLVSLSSEDHPRAHVVSYLDLQICVVPNHRDGMSASLRTAAKVVAPHGTAMMILLPDMPAIEINDLREILNAHAANPDSIIQASSITGEPGHPVLFPNHLLSEFEDLCGDKGAAALLKAHSEKIKYVLLNDNRARLDLDTPEDWAAWRALDL